MVSQLPDRDEYSTTKQQLLAQIDVCMGGKAAEELIFGEEFVTTGATSDLSAATRTARHMVEDCGMSARIGPLSLSDKLGSETRKVADAEVSDILKASYEVWEVGLGAGREGEGPGGGAHGMVPWTKHGPKQGGSTTQSGGLALGKRHARVFAIQRGVNLA